MWFQVLQAWNGRNDFIYLQRTKQNENRKWERITNMENDTKKTTHVGTLVPSLLPPLLFLLSSLPYSLLLLILSCWLVRDAS